jgi:hypothetical protein
MYDQTLFMITKNTSLNDKSQIFNLMKCITRIAYHIYSREDEMRVIKEIGHDFNKSSGNRLLPMSNTCNTN